MLNNLKDVIKYTKGRNYTISGAMETSRIVKVNGKKINLPMSYEQFEMVVK